MTQHGGPPGWLEESDPAGKICVVMDCPVSMPLLLTDSTACPAGLKLLSCELLENSAAVADVPVLDV
jgi:hypothetical protein